MAQSRTILLVSLAIVALQFALVSKASAQAELSLSQGTSSILVTDNGPGDTNLTMGAITFNGSVGSFTGTFSSGTTKPLNGSAIQPQLSLVSTDLTTSQGGLLTILFGDTDFGPVPNGAVSAHIGGTSGGQVSYLTFLDASNASLALTTSLTHQDGLGGATFDSNFNGNTAFGLGTSLTQKITVTQEAGSVTGLNSTLRITNALVTPDSGSAIALLAGALCALEGIRRRFHTIS